MYHAPCGVYQTRGDDRWCAISVGSDAQWSALCDALGQSDLSAQDRTTVKLEEVERFTTTQEAEELATRLQSAGVAASAVMTGRDLATDEQLTARRFVTTIADPSLGEMSLGRIPVLFPPGTTHELQPAPRLGEANYHVTCELLGHSDEDYHRWLADGVLE